MITTFRSPFSYARLVVFSFLLFILFTRVRCVRVTAVPRALGSISAAATDLTGTLSGTRSLRFHRRRYVQLAVWLHHDVCSVFIGSSLLSTHNAAPDRIRRLVVIPWRQIRLLLFPHFFASYFYHSPQRASVLVAFSRISSWRPHKNLFLYSIWFRCFIWYSSN